MNATLGDGRTQPYGMVVGKSSKIEARPGAIQGEVGAGS